MSKRSEPAPEALTFVSIVAQVLTPQFSQTFERYVFEPSCAGVSKSNERTTPGPLRRTSKSSALAFVTATDLLVDARFPRLSATLSVTAYVPGAGNWCLTAAPLAAAPSP